MPITKAAPISLSPEALSLFFWWDNTRHRLPACFRLTDWLFVADSTRWAANMDREIAEARAGSGTPLTLADLVTTLERLRRAARSGQVPLTSPFEKERGLS